MRFYRLTLFLLPDWSEERAFSVPISWGPQFSQQAQVVIVKEKGEIVTVSVLAVSDSKAKAKQGSVCVGRDLGKHK